MKEIYICDYDGANQRRVTINQTLNINPDLVARRAVASPTRPYRRGMPDIFISNIYQGTMENPLRSRRRGELPAGLVAGRRRELAFQSNRDGNAGDLRDEP